MEQLIKDILTPINSFVWGPVMLVMLVGTGLYLNIGLKFYSFRNWIRAYKCLWEGRSDKSSHGEISPWNALMTAIAADIGTGNIVGVATAIAIGGPGALFWMWVTALVGMMTKFSEVLLSVHFREKTPAGYVLHQERTWSKVGMAWSAVRRFWNTGLYRHRRYGSSQCYMRQPCFLVRP